MRLRSHSKRLSRDVLLYERKALSVREKEPTKWRHGSPAESGLSRACRPWPPGGRQTTKRAVSVKVSADGPRLLALAVPVNQRTVPGGPGGDFYGRRTHGRARGRANGIPGGGKGLKTNKKHYAFITYTGSPFLFRPLPVRILLVNPFYKLNEVLV